MTEDQKKTLAQIKKHQNSGWVHPMTCGVDSRHEVLEGQVRDGKVTLVCPTCGWDQGGVPGAIFMMPGDAPI